MKTKQKSNNVFTLGTFFKSLNDMLKDVETEKINSEELNKIIHEQSITRIKELEDFLKDETKNKIKIKKNKDKKITKSEEKISESKTRKTKKEEKEIGE